MSSSVASALSIQNLSKNYEKVQALDGMTFSVEAGEIFGLLGPNGAGKTTLISVVTQMEIANSGAVEVFGKTVNPGDIEVRKIIGFVPQELVSHGFFNIDEVLTFQSGYYGLLKNQARIDFLIERLGLEPHRKKKVMQLSGGMKRRFMIAKALVHKPRLLLLDEPTAGVDIELRTTLWNFVTDLNKNEGLSVLLTTHYLEEAEKLCRRVAVISHGRLVRLNRTKDLINELTDRDVTLQVQKLPPNYKSQLLVAEDGLRLTYRIPRQMTLGELLVAIGLQAEDVVDVSTQEGRLEDAVLRLLNPNVSETT